MKTESERIHAWYSFSLLLPMLLQAVCCSDHEHCCPSGTTCDVAAGKCNQASHSMSWYEVALRNENRVTSKDVVCPGGEAKCPDGSTCCELASGDYGCCPLPKVFIFVCFLFVSKSLTI